jgi:hypothetical protein
MHDTHAQTRRDGVGSPRQDHGHPNPYTPTPTGDPSHDDRDLSPRASKYFSDLYALEEAQTSGSAARPHDQHTLPSSDGIRTTSVVTLFPRGVDYVRVPKETDTSQAETSNEQNSTAQKESFFKKHYRRLKELHDNGPPGEAQTFLAGMNSYLKERKAVVEFEMYSPRHKHGAKPVSREHHPPQSVRESPLTHRTADENNSRTRKDSVVSYGSISRTSQEVPVKLRRTVVEMDINKPLPPLPPLDVTPMQRLRSEKGYKLNLHKPLPRTPLYCSSISKKRVREPVEDSPVDALWESIQTQTVGPARSAKQPVSSTQIDAKSPQWVEQASERTRQEDSSNISKCPIPPSGKPKPSKVSKAHDALKAKISHPIPITQTLNNRFPELAPYTAEAAEGKPKTPSSPTWSSPTWLDKLAHPTLPAIPAMSAIPTFYKPKKRPASDESFACQGLGGGDVYREMVIGAGALSAGEKSTETIEETAVPKPLFFRRPKVSDAGAEQGMNGRWV